MTSARSRSGGDGGPRTGGRPRRRARRPLPPRTGVQPPRAIIRRSGESWALQSALERHGLGPVAGRRRGRPRRLRRTARGRGVHPAAERRQAASRASPTPSCSAPRSASGSRRSCCGAPSTTAWCSSTRPRSTAAACTRRTSTACAAPSRASGCGRATCSPTASRSTGFGVPSLAVPKGDLAAACVAAASILAKTTRDRLMTELHERRPEYRFDLHKGYCTPTHSAAARRARSQPRPPLQLRERGRCGSPRRRPGGRLLRRVGGPQ